MRLARSGNRLRFNEHVRYEADVSDYWMIIEKSLETLMAGERWSESLKDHSIGFKDINMLAACVYSPLMAAAA